MALVIRAFDERSISSHQLLMAPTRSKPRAGSGSRSTPKFRGYALTRRYSPSEAPPGQGISRRRSTWADYDLSHTAVEPDRIVEGVNRLRCANDSPLVPSRSAAPSGSGHDPGRTPERVNHPRTQEES